MTDLQSELPSVAIITLNWNNYEDTAACLRSLQEVEYSNFEVFVVDNGSEDDSLSKLKSDFPEIAYIESETNRGFAAGNNLAIKRAIEENFDYVLLLNNDTVVSKNFLTPLVLVAENEPNVGIVGGIIKEFDSEKIWYGGAQFFSHVARAKHSRNIQKNIPYSTGYITGALMLISASVIDDIGYLDDSYFFGMEDVEYSHRAKRKGWEIRVVPSSQIQHKVSGTAGQDSPFWIENRTKNRFHYAQTYLHPLSRIIFYSAFTVETIAKLIFWTIRGDEPVAKCKSILRGIL
ncbi:Glycosyl transferase family 2 [Halanaeroarchaeum sp. HSR-CO]|uniref:glycosyltransferase family 2 protein n=1 Tax=Halanaeroarchaeum sp. HSR-CO TaxID=2866382 RepID=UPI00217D26FC|nr:glycosyltransferase family 2 protein [Halanaeroarchaeum sp. HSR-CO]UWG48135.1 Glycosyl transferase family 2 [Halanaeroarchaeum sp. HSR-CO]